MLAPVVPGRRSTRLIPTQAPVSSRFFWGQPLHVGLSFWKFPLPTHSPWSGHIYGIFHKGFYGYSKKQWGEGENLIPYVSGRFPTLLVPPWLGQRGFMYRSWMYIWNLGLKCRCLRSFSVFGSSTNVSARARALHSRHILCVVAMCGMNPAWSGCTSEGITPTRHWVRTSQ